MKKNIFSSCLLSLALCLTLFFAQSAFATQGSVLSHIESATEPYDSLQVESAHQLPHKTVRSMEDYQGGTFKVLARKNFISRYPCSVCHTDKPVKVANGALFTHGDITIKHGLGDNKLACIDCHHAKDRDYLIDKQGRKIDYDHSYQLCGQCHFRPKRDWLGGAHGKRETYWAGERVVRNCTTCHNPHAPAFKIKMPETYSLPLDE